ncbi:MAG: hypothetical protein JO360_05100 [Acidobacteria bacterium]|nr:hypothetical protein [Acidobacteriota bacterium]
MRSKRSSSLLALAAIVLAALACNASFTTANISGLKISKEKGGSETSTFGAGDTVYVAADIANTSDKHKVTAKLMTDDGKPVPGAETTIDVPGAATANFTFTPPGNWEAGKYKVEVTMKDDSGKQVDQKSGSFTVSG